MSRPRSASALNLEPHGVGLSPTHPLPLSERLGPYRLCLELASGGMASVYLARREDQAVVNRCVALKRIHPHLANDPAFVEMFWDEARIASLIQHPNVCNVVDFDCVDGEYYLAMEFLVGESLSAVFRAMVHHTHDKSRAPSRAALVAKIVADACEGLHAAHELRGPSGQPLGVVHRDVSPENLFVTYGGVVKVVDFGVARAVDQRHLTMPGMIKGKLAYMSPEVLRGALPDRRADVWGMGVVLWELLTGARLFHRGTDVETLTTIAEVRVPPPSQLTTDVPPDFDEIVRKALAPDPDARYATARDLAKDLTLALARRGDAVGLAELSEWMEELFPAGAACKRRLLEMAVPGPMDSPHSRITVPDIGESRPTTIRPPRADPRSSRTRTGSTGIHSCSEPPTTVPSEDAGEPPAMTVSPTSAPTTTLPERRSKRRFLGSARGVALAAALCALPTALALLAPGTVSVGSGAPSLPAAKPAVPTAQMSVLGAPTLAEPAREATNVRVSLPPSTPLASPGSYAVDIEPAPDGDPMAVVLRFRATRQ